LEDILSEKQEIECLAFDQDTLDVTNFEVLEEMFKREKPSVIFNCVAYNAVDAAENTEGSALAHLLNVEVPKELAKLCKKYDSVLVQYSTGYVFDGESEVGYSEESKPNPISIYGQTKLMGESAVIENAGSYYIVRLNWLYGKSVRVANSAPSKKSFPEIVLELAAKCRSGEGSVPKFVSDEFSSPTYAWDLARASLDLFLSKYPSGIYHPDSQEKVSWFDWAQEILKLNGLEDLQIESIKSVDMPRAAKRPKNSLLLNGKYKEMRNWREALAEYYNK
jgi:dTDP-4-dehydrorhamnose reductase